MPKRQYTVLGFDPGIATTGWAVVTGTPQEPTLVDCGSIETPKSKSMPGRLEELHSNVIELLEQFSPDQVVVEELFVSTNIKTVMQVAQARGVILAACASLHHLEPMITTLNPKRLKQQLTGTGNATKKQVKYMVITLFKLTEYPQLDDVIDAIALAYTGLRVPTSF